MTQLRPPEPGQGAAEAFVAEHLGHLACDSVAGSPAIRGGQLAADGALASFDVSGYAAARNEVHPPDRRGASRLSPYIRYGLLTLRDVWDRVDGGPVSDVQKFRDELRWQEYARHWYARLGAATKRGVRNELAPFDGSGSWDDDLACVRLCRAELETDGWLVNQTRMWLASHWAVRQGRSWREGEDYFFRHLLDGSRAANRLGWQWTTGVGSAKHYGFSRSQVEKRAPDLCAGCAHNDRCPIQLWPDDPSLVATSALAELRSVTNTTVYGPSQTPSTGHADIVWLTAESLGLADPAMMANPELPALFVFDEPLLATLQLSSKRLVFLTETLADLAQHRELMLLLGDPAQLLHGHALATTYAPVPGFRRLAQRLTPVEVHPWPWLVEPSTASVASFSAWRKATKLA